MTTQITDHEGEAEARLPFQFKDKPKFLALLSVLTTPFQSLEDALWSLFVVTIDDAVGDALDKIGKIVGQPRTSLVDDTYRRYIKARIATNRSKGTIHDLIVIARLILDAETSQNYYTTSAEFTAGTGKTATALYNYQEASGNVLDKIGSAHLTLTGTPQFQFAMADGRLGVYYNALARKHSADVNAPGTSSFVYGGVFQIVTDPGSSSTHIMGRINATIAECVEAFLPTATDSPQVIIRDNGPNTLTLTLSTLNVRANGPWFLTIQVDKAANLIRTRCSNLLGTVEEKSGSIAGFGSVDGASQEYGSGVLPARTYGCAKSYDFYMTGAQCEGATVLADLHAAHGWS